MENLTTPRSVFSKPFSQEQEDEEALKLAALERLPTYSRMKKGILPGEDGEAREVDVNKLGSHEKKILLDRLLKVAEEDNEKFLLKLKDRIDSVGIDLPKIEVRFEHLKIGAEAYVGGRALPTVFNSLINVAEGLLGRLNFLSGRKRPFSLLQDVSGIINPSRMVLLLGPPSSGKTTLLLALAGKLDSELKVSGKVTYNGHTMNEFVPQRTSAYISQHDVHVGEMTVRETLDFSAKCQGVGSGYELFAELLRREKAANIKPDPNVDVYTKFTSRSLVLSFCILSIIAEMLVGPEKALFMDEISTGLDSSTTFQIINALRQSIHILNGTAFISLLQPAPETYDLFNDIILLSDGQIVYQGPSEHILEFFETMGFKCPERKGVADFLQELSQILRTTILYSSCFYFLLV
ncbi:Abc transporter g family member [Thalictrum thalictroides]|uniref:Abc transporter g family member n=1 Tax=Thalictrum thalictroides TaxID=46969 RepID=A0A7J6WNH9_THATH|nr:Abc transporter g family member [Thalictrum thalictroides]